MSIRRTTIVGLGLLSVLSVAFAIWAPIASAAPQVRLLSMLRGSPPNISQWDDRPFLRLPDGSMIVIADSAHFTFKSKYYSQVDKRVILRLIRVRPDGRIDQEFAKSRLARGIRIGHGNEFWRFLAPVQLNANQAMVLGNAGWSNMRAIRIIFDIRTGELDPTFGVGGAEVIESADMPIRSFLRPRAVAALTGGGVADCGGIKGLLNGPAYLRFTGAPQSMHLSLSFQPATTQRTQVCEALVGLDDGGLFAAGVDSFGGWAPTIWMIKLQANGEFESSFGASGTAQLTPTKHHDPLNTSVSVSDVVPTRDGGAIVLGSIRGEFKDGFFIAKITASGAMDTAFANNGWMEIRRMHVYSALVAPNGMILLGGGWRKGPSRALRPAVGRLLPNGTWDASFGSKGIAKGVWYDESLRAPLTQMVFTGSDVLAGTVVRKKDWGRLVPARLVRISGLY